MTHDEQKRLPNPSLYDIPEYIGNIVNVLMARIKELEVEVEQFRQPYVVASGPYTPEEWKEVPREVRGCVPVVAERVYIGCVPAVQRGRGES